MELTGRHVTVYGQHEVVKDLIAARIAAGRPILFEAKALAVEGFESGRPAHPATRMTGRSIASIAISSPDATDSTASRAPAIPAGVLTTYERDYPFGWLGILAEAPPSSEELIYANHPNGFALLSMRSPTIGRLYLQCAPDEDAGTWSDDRIWSELATRLASDGFHLNQGPILQKGVTAMRSFVTEPMQCGRLFLAGDAAHIVPPTGAKGMNLAIADVLVLSRALERFYARGETAGLEAYSATCLRRVWKAQRFSWFMTSMLHRFPGPHRVRGAGAAGGARLRHLLARRRDVARRELHGTAPGTLTPGAVSHADQ